METTDPPEEPHEIDPEAATQLHYANDTEESTQILNQGQDGN